MNLLHSLYGYKNGVKSAEVSYVGSTNEVASIEKVEYYYLKVTGLSEGTTSIIFKPPYLESGVSKYVN